MQFGTPVSLLVFEVPFDLSNGAADRATLSMIVVGHFPLLSPESYVETFFSSLLVVKSCLRL